ncbi:hypothetical protein V1520DRAFT_343788 [Lipomyces starkeyi]|uniref:PH domain-containing protein n=1 Tax=Lipomyces starkeyi NRRL Y-11557 TaxID=675824 RepID=A0A1E3QFU5_LIPST|nr:hypothetical protein LIPSTDRAFT_436 [Lipomyces starkeyi NRRL Y-11557]
MVHTASSSIATSSTSRPGTSMTTGTGYSFQRFNALTVNDLFEELKTTEVQYIRDLGFMRSVRLVEELLISHSALEPSLTKILEWAEEAAPIYNQYVKEYMFNPDETQEMIYLKRRPLVRLRFYAKFFKKLEEFLPNVKNISVPTSTYRALVTSARVKVESEKLRIARLQVDFSRVRSFDNLQPVASWFNSQFISMRSYCQCHLTHRTGKTFSGLPVEILLITEPLMSDALAVCQLHEFHRYLLFPTFRRADVVYSLGSSYSAIALTSYNGSVLELEFSSMENRSTWAAKFQEIFPPAPALPSVAQRHQSNSNFEGLQISTGNSKSAETDGVLLPAEILESELQSPRLFEEPEIKPYIVSDTSPQKKRHSVFKYGSMVAQATQAASQKMQVRFSRISTDSKVAGVSSSASPYKQRQELLRQPSSVQGIVLTEEESPDLKQKEAAKVAEQKVEPCRPDKGMDVATDATLEKVANNARECATPGITEKNKPERDVTERAVNSVTKPSISETESVPDELAAPSESTIQVVTPSRDGVMALAGASTSSERSFVPETFHATSTTDSSYVSLADSRPKSSLSFARRKDYGSSTVSRLSSAFRKISPRQVAADNTVYDAGNESATSGFHLRLATSGKRASTSTTVVSPILSDRSSLASVSTEITDDGIPKAQKHSSSVLRNMKFARSMMRSSLSNTAPSVGEYGSRGNKSVNCPSMTVPIPASPVVQQGDEKTKKFNVFSRSARKARAAASQLSVKVQPEVEAEKATTVSTVPPSPSVEESVVETIRKELVSEEQEIEAGDEESKTEAAIPERRTLKNGDADSKKEIFRPLPRIPTGTAPEANADDKGDQASVEAVYAGEENIQDFVRVPTVSPLKINVELKPPALRRLSVSPGYAPSLGEDIVVTNDGAEVALKSEDIRTTCMDRLGIDELIQEVEIFTPRINISGDVPLPSTSSSDSASESPPLLPLLPLRVGTSRLSHESRSSRSSRTSTVRDSKATLRAVADQGLERYVLIDRPMSDSEEEADEHEAPTYNIFDVNMSGSFLPTSEQVAIAYEEEVDMSLPCNSVASLNIGQRTSLPQQLSPVSSVRSIVSAVSRDSSVRGESRPSSPLKKEYAPSSISSGSVWDDSTSVSEDATSVSASATTPSPTLQNSDDMKIVLFRSNALVYQWSAQHRWDRICEKELRVIVTVTEDSGAIEVWPITGGGDQSIVPSSTSSISHGNSVQFKFGDKALSTSNDGSILTIALDKHVNIRRSTAFDIHVKKAGSSGITMFRTRTAIEADRMYNAMNSCRLDFQGISSGPYSSSAPSIASSETSSSHSSIGSSLFSGHASIWYHPLLDSTNHSGNNSGDSSITGIGEVLLIKDFKCRLFLRQNALKWRNLGPANLSVTGIPDGVGNKVTVKRHDGQVFFDLVVQRNSFERVGRTGLAVHVMDELSEHADAVADGESRIAVYMLQFKGEKDTNLVDRAIKETV